MSIWLRTGPGLGLRETHICHDLELLYVNQLCGQQLPECFLLVAKLPAHLLGWGWGRFSWGTTTRTAATICEMLLDLLHR